MTSEWLFLRSAVDIIHSGRNIKMGINTTLQMMSEYFDFRFPSLFLKDMVTGQYGLEISPEIPSREKSRISERMNQWRYHRSINSASVVILGEEEDGFDDNPFAPYLGEAPLRFFVMVAIEEPSKTLPLSFFTFFCRDMYALNRRIDVLRTVGRVLYFSLNSYGYRLNVSDEPHRRPIPAVLDGVIGKSTAMREVADLVQKVAASRASVLITGESGTGKELIAQAIHKLSIRSNSPFVAVNCAALSHTVLESELFGHEKGAFTGAMNRRIGRFEKADGGTLFLDEIGEVSAEFQSKLLRVLQEGEFERVGGNETIKVDVRIICATNQDLHRAVLEKRFREDLYYRVNVVNITMPPLRERAGDVALLAQHFLEKINEDNNTDISIHSHDIGLLDSYPWKGNVRELQNAVFRAFLEQKQGYANFRFLQYSGRSEESLPSSSSRVAPLAPAIVESRREYERRKIEEALQATKGVQTEAAHILGISPRQLRYRISKYGIPVRKF
ncbi:sigma 54-interacting transcriptional regulator [Desulfurispirillum indicum]|uniref:sigma-54 interaction domain-containing protein n=1 Tax=Desulfurispirillum indicum TaxID=936456 RepID=UPI001CFA3B92|nr:sigma 54-interacting transcriptional regulator [Desulfurispirillum indicum]UCZ56784.1 sigma 54-interacting transcriptional regulator [Desulfurispirillum indicum]